MEGEAGAPSPEPEPVWFDKVLAVNRNLQAAGIPYAFGGAISLNYHRDARGTADIDLLDRTRDA